MDRDEMTRIGVYDEYWSTLGGGEQFAGGIAAALTDRYDVDLIGPEKVDPAVFGTRLGLDLSAAGFADATAFDVSAVSAAYDLFVNVTYLSMAVNRAPKGLYVAHFPGEPGGWKSAAKDRVRNATQRLWSRPAFVLRSGFYDPLDDGTSRRTDGGAVLDVYAAVGQQIGITLTAPNWAGADAPTVRLWDRQQLLAEGVVTAGGEVTLRFGASGARPQSITIESPTYRHRPRPDVAWRYGVDVVGFTVGNDRHSVPLRRMAARFLPPDRYGNLATYDTVVANSAFTAGWVERLWGVHAGVLYPPVGLLSDVGRHGNSIVSIGRFFDPIRGHSKKQLEMVSAFRRLCETGGDRGWKLHLIGGASAEDRHYAMAVKKAAQGLAVQVHFNAPGDELRRLVAEASIYWHAGGFGEDVEHHPHRFEHFGISVVEAMSAGLVPVVFGAAGPAEIVTDGSHGLHFSTLDQLAALTGELIDDPARRAALAAGARTRAEEFGRTAFADRLHDLVAATLSG